MIVLALVTFGIPVGCNKTDSASQKKHDLVGPAKDKDFIANYRLDQQITGQIDSTSRKKVDITGLAQEANSARSAIDLETVSSNAGVAEPAAMIKLLSGKQAALVAIQVKFPAFRSMSIPQVEAVFMKACKEKINYKGLIFFFAFAIALVSALVLLMKHH